MEDEKINAGHESTRTVDSNGHALCQDEAICTDKGRNATERVQLEVLRADIRGTSFDKLNVEIVFLCDC